MTRFVTAAVFTLAAVSVVSALPTPCFAQQDRAADLRCIAAFATRASAATDDKGKQQATIGLIYFFGRLDGEAPQTDLQAELARLGQTMTDAELTGEVAPCAKRLGERAQVLMTVGNNLQEMGK